jgi:hypothetical protein
MELFRVRPRLLQLLVMCCALVACDSSQPPITRDMLVGDYIYQSQDPEGKPTDYAWNHLTLLSDSSYRMITGGPTKAKTETKGSWQLSSSFQGPEVILDRSGFPIQVKGGEIRLLIDTDVGIWYTKQSK